MTNEEKIMVGTWSCSDNTLNLQFTGTDVTESFTVLELKDDRMKLLAEDGSQMMLGMTNVNEPGKAQACWMLRFVFFKW